MVPRLLLSLLCLIVTLPDRVSARSRPAEAPVGLKVHGIFRSHMVLQQNEPITIWGWAPVGKSVAVSFGGERAMAEPTGEAGHWEVTFDARPASHDPLALELRCGEEVVKREDLLIGDVWVMNGQSNMAFALKAVYQAGFESAQAHLPHLRHFKVRAGAESEFVETDLRDEFIFGADVEDKDWRVITPETCLDMTAIGYFFGSRLQRALQIPIGIIDTSRGGASIESLVPRHKFADDPAAAAYLKWVDGRREAFSIDDFLAEQMEKWKEAEARYQKQIAEDREKGVTRQRRRPRKPDGSIRTWSVPGRSPSDAASCYNGMFGVFKGLNIKGVAFHQGFNNAMMNTSCKPKFYRTLMKLMVEGWREDFGADLPVAVIGLCAGGKAQTRLNFEEQGFSTAAYIRESQRLGLRDAGGSAPSVFIPAYDQKIPQLHTKKKKALGLRTARWALHTVYGMEEVVWETVENRPLLIPSIPAEDLLLLFEKPVRVDDFGSEIEGFSIAGEDGIFYLARAVHPETKNKDLQFRQIVVSSPLVPEPVSVRYAWARAPMGNLKVGGLPWQPLPSFRTDTIDFSPEVSHQDPEGSQKNRESISFLKAAAAKALETRLKTSGRPD